MKERLVLRCILFLGGIAPAIFEAGLWSDSQFLIGNLLIFGASLIPYIVLGILANFLKPLLINLTSLFCTTMAGYSLYIYYKAYVVHPSEDAGVLFFIIPFYQLIAVVIFSGLTLVLNRFVK
jgi:hypothetical protein